MMETSGISKNPEDSLHLVADRDHGIDTSYSVLLSLLFPAVRFAFVPPVLLARQMFPLQATYSVSPFLYLIEYYELIRIPISHQSSSLFIG
jgi:hypothetical protein